jgi:hypothetical protein
VALSGLRRPQEVDKPGGWGDSALSATERLLGNFGGNHHQDNLPTVVLLRSIVSHDGFRLFRPDVEHVLTGARDADACRGRRCFAALMQPRVRCEALEDARVDPDPMGVGASAKPLVPTVDRWRMDQQIPQPVADSTVPDALERVSYLFPRETGRG